MARARHLAAATLGLLLSLASTAVVLANSTNGPFPK